MQRKLSELQKIDQTDRAIEAMKALRYAHVAIYKLHVAIDRRYPEMIQFLRAMETRLLAEEYLLQQRIEEESGG